MAVGVGLINFCEQRQAHRSSSVQEALVAETCQSCYLALLAANRRLTAELAR